MTVLGMTVRIKDGRPLVRGVFLPDDDLDSAAPRTFRHISQLGQSIADQLQQFHDDLTTKLTAESVAACVIREADDGRQGGLTLPRRTRYRAEGVALAAVRHFSASVVIMNGQQIGKAGPGDNLSEVQAAAAGLVARDYEDAATAALAARSLLA